MKKIFVMGGGGFAMEPENLRLDRYIVNLAGKARPKVCFIGTASGDSDRYTNDFYQAYQSLECQPTHLSLFKPPTRDLRGFILEQDILHVGGGNTKNLLCLWREWGLDSVVRQAYAQGVVLSGMSAGMICWFEQALTDSYGVGLEIIQGLGLLKGCAVPHFDGEVERRPTCLELLKQRKITDVLALDDGVGTLFIDGKMVENVSSRQQAGGYLFESGSLQMQSLEVNYLY